MYGVCMFVQTCTVVLRHARMYLCHLPPYLFIYFLNLFMRWSLLLKPELTLLSGLTG